MSARPWARRRAAGFTLMELMVVMVIMASLMGLGTGLFMKMGKATARDSALANLQAMIVNVRNGSSRYPAMLRLDPERQQVQGLVQEVRQELHFDPRKMPGAEQPIVATGIEGRECNLGGAQVEPTGGRIGGGLKLGGGRVDCGSFAAYDVTDGVTVELYMKLDAKPATTDLVTKGDMLKLRLESSGQVTGTIAVQDEHGAARASTSATIPPVRPGQWLGVRLTYDRSHLSLATDNGFGWVTRGDPKPEGRVLVPSKDASLSVGGFQGVLDDFRFAGVHSTEPMKMPAGSKLVGKKDQKEYSIYFNGGRLDPDQHHGPQSIVVDAEGRRTVLEIATNGSLSVSYGDAGAPAPDEKKRDQAPPPKKE
jgi:prepilin-type N-terminal cleavage/methylation domain-containing protein